MAGIIAVATRKGLRLPLVELTARLGGHKSLKKLLAALTVVEGPVPGRPKFIVGKSAAAYTFITINKERFIVIPRIKGGAFLRANIIAGIQNAPDMLPPPVKIPAERCIQGERILYSYQEAAINYLCNVAMSEEKADAGQAFAYGKLDTGLGKTCIAAGVVATKGVATAVVVVTDAIREQWIDEFAETYPNMRVAAFSNPPKGSNRIPPSPKTHDVVIFIVNTFRKHESEILDGYGLVIFDEAHEFHSPVNRQSLWLAQTRYVLGVSATPNQESARGLDSYVSFHLGPPIDLQKIPGFDASDTKFTGRVRKIEYSGDPRYCETATTTAGTMSAIGTIANIVSDPARLAMVVAEVNLLLHSHLQPDSAKFGLGIHPKTKIIRKHGIFVFAEHRAFLPKLCEALTAKFGKDTVYAPELTDETAKMETAKTETAKIESENKEILNEEDASMTILRGGVAKNAVSKARENKTRIVLTTYGYSRRGVSLPDMTALILATPRRHNSTQILGRILRRGSDQSIERVVVDIVDVRSGLKSQFAERTKTYSKKGWKVQTIKLNWESFAPLNQSPNHSTVAIEEIKPDDDEDEMDPEDLVDSLYSIAEEPETPD